MENDGCDLFNTEALSFDSTLDSLMDVDYMPEEIVGNALPFEQVNIDPEPPTLLMSVQDSSRVDLGNREGETGVNVEACPVEVIKLGESQPKNLTGISVEIDKSESIKKDTGNTKETQIKSNKVDKEHSGNGKSAIKGTESSKSEKVELLKDGNSDNVNSSLGKAGSEKTSHRKSSDRNQEKVEIGKSSDKNRDRLEKGKTEKTAKKKEVEKMEEQTVQIDIEIKEKTVDLVRTKDPKERIKDKTAKIVVESKQHKLGVRDKTTSTGQTNSEIIDKTKANVAETREASPNFNEIKAKRKKNLEAKMKPSVKRSANDKTSPKSEKNVDRKNDSSSKSNSSSLETDEPPCKKSKTSMQQVKTNIPAEINVTITKTSDGGSCPLKKEAPGIKSISEKCGTEKVNKSISEISLPVKVLESNSLIPSKSISCSGSETEKKISELSKEQTNDVNTGNFEESAPVVKPDNEVLSTNVNEKIEVGNINRDLNKVENDIEMKTNKGEEGESTADRDVEHGNETAPMDDDYNDDENDDDENDDDVNVDEEVIDNGVDEEDAIDEEQVDDDDDFDDEDVDDDEIHNWLEEGLTKEEIQEKRREELKDGEFVSREKIILEEKGTSPFDVLPVGWVLVLHNSGMPVYLHKESRVCTFARPYYLGSGSTRRHKVPLSCIPCLQYRQEMENEKLQETMPNKDTNTDQNKATDETSCAADKDFPGPKPVMKNTCDGKTIMNIEPDELNKYCRGLFQFKSVTVKKFKTWKEKRAHLLEEKKKELALAPKLAPETKLITCPIPAEISNTKKSKKKEFVLNPEGKTAVSILHEYTQNVLKVQPTYQFKEISNAEFPFQATVLINGMQYGSGIASGKRQAKNNGAKATLDILIPELTASWKDKNNGTRQKTEPEVDLKFFEDIAIEDPRVAELCVKSSLPQPYQVLHTCLQRNYGLGDTTFKVDKKMISNQKTEFTLTVGKRSCQVICKNKREAKQQASQKMLQELHPFLKNWASILRLYSKTTEVGFDERKEELSTREFHHEKKKNKEILVKLQDAMRKLKYQRETASMLGPVPPPTSTPLDLG